MKKIFTYLLLTSAFTLCLAGDQSATPAGKSADVKAQQADKNKAPIKKPDEALEYQKVIDDYKAYLGKVRQEIRDEIQEYKNALREMRRKRIELYNALSQEAQQFLAVEGKLKKSLPINRKKLEDKKDSSGKSQ